MARMDTMSQRENTKPKSSNGTKNTTRKTGGEKSSNYSEELRDHHETLIERLTFELGISNSSLKVLESFVQLLMSNMSDADAVVYANRLHGFISAEAENNRQSLLKRAIAAITPVKRSDG